ncbi:MAG: hypothetical protein HFH41_01665 [Lachnospiraceae bacterium]|nr:hypothetical protein [Lachnospiraceae bacterium]
MFKIKEWTKTLTDVTEMTKKEYWLTIATSLFCGIIIGFVFAPRRVKHTMIGSNNGSSNKNNGNGNGIQEDGEDWEEDADVVHFN